MSDVTKLKIGSTDYDIVDATALHNTATGANSLTVAGTPTGNSNATQIGYSGYVEGYGASAYGYNTQAKKGYSLAIGYGSGVGLSEGTDGQYSIAIGYQAYTSADDAIQLGRGSNSTARTFQVGFNNSGSPLVYNMLDGDTGFIPLERYNKSTASHGLAIGTTGHANLYAGTAIGMDTDVKGNNDIVVGYQTTAKTDQSGSVHGSTVIGSKTAMKSSGSCHIGAYGHNTVDGTFTVSLGSDGNDYTTFNDYTLLDVDGKIPGPRMSLQDAGAPTTSTVGSVGQFYVDTTNQDAYICVDDTSSTYTWKKITP